ncbi:MAG: M1 family metallopeptidase [Hyphomonas sp.]|nr:M1 family metallopeptidase [Hyphomonas sp.]
MTSRFSAALLAGAASLLVLAACTSPGPATDDAAAAATTAEATPVKLDIAPAGQLPTGVAPTAYRIDVVTDPNKEDFTGHVEIDLALDAPHARIWLHSLGPVMSSVKAVLADGTEIPASFETVLTEDGVSRLDFETPLPAGTTTLVFDYEAPYDRNLAGLYKVEQNGRAYLITQMEQIDARRMFPSFDEPRFKTPYTLTITAPAGMAVAANGAETSSEPLDGGLVRHNFATTRPIQSYLFAMMVGPYDSMTAASIPATDLRAEPVPLRGFAAAGKGSELKDALDITDEMVTWQEEYFDYPYPYGKLDLIAAADYAWGAMENAGAIVYREAALLINDRTTLARRRGIYGTHAHELGHQWFGNLVTPAWWDDIWLNEAFATWISAKTMQGIDPEGGWELQAMKSALNAMPTDSLASTRQIRNPINTNGDINDAFDSITYRKGGAVLNMFETYLGEDRFRDGIRLHMRRFEDGVATSDDFMQSLADGSGQPDVVPSFTSFLTQPGIPYLNVQLSCPEGAAPMLTVTQSRYAPLGSTVDTEAQLWKIPFAARVHQGDGHTVIRHMLTDKTTEIPLEGACPDWVMPNAGGRGYWRFVTDEKNAAALNAAYAELTTGEQMLLTDSVDAGFDAGLISAEGLLEGMAANAGGDPVAISEHIDLVAKVARMLDEDGRKAFAPWVEATYGPVWDYLDSRPATALSEPERLLAPEIWSTLLQNGNREADRAAMAARANAYFGIGQEADPTALSSEEVGSGVLFGVRAGGRDFYNGVMDYVRASSNQTERAVILYTMAASGSEDVVADLLKTSLGDEITGSELYTIFGAAMGNDAARPTVWPLVKDNFAALANKMPSVRRQQLAKVSGNFCTAEDVADAEAFFNSQASVIPGYERNLAQGVEAGTLCAARLAAKSTELKDAVTK